MAAEAPQSTTMTAGDPNSTVLVIPGRIEDKDDADRARGLRAAACLWQLLAAAKAQLSAVDWHALGLQEAEAALEAWERGGHHGFFRVWEERKATTGRPAPSPTELRARRMVILLCITFERSGLNRRAARKFAARELERAGVFATPPLHRTIERWQAEQPPLTSADEQLLATAIAVCGIGQPHRLARYFVGLAHLVHNPAAKVVHEIAP
jgi:hypothetical protein